MKTTITLKNISIEGVTIGEVSLEHNYCVEDCTALMSKIPETLKAIKDMVREERMTAFADHLKRQQVHEEAQKTPSPLEEIVLRNIKAYAERL